MKKFICFFILMFFAISNTNAIYIGNEISLTEIEYIKFRDMGFSEEEIFNLTSKEYNYYKDFLNGHTTTDTKYIMDTYIYMEENYLNNDKIILDIITEEITADEYNNGKSISGSLATNPEILNKMNNKISISPTATLSPTYETTYKRLIISTTNVLDAKKTLITGSLTWKQAPKVRSYDIFAVRTTNQIILNNTYLASTSAKFKSTYVNCDNPSDYTLKSTYEYSHSNWNIATKNSTTKKTKGAGITFPLEGNRIGCYDADTSAPITLAPILSSRISVTAQSETSGTSEKAYISYQHATENVSLNSVKKSYSFSSTGLGGVIKFNNGYDQYYDGMKGLSISYTSP